MTSAQKILTFSPIWGRLSESLNSHLYSSKIGSDSSCILYRVISYSLMPWAAHCFRSSWRADNERPFYPGVDPENGWYTIFIPLFSAGIQFARVNYTRILIRTVDTWNPAGYSFSTDHNFDSNSWQQLASYPLSVVIFRRNRIEPLASLIMIALLRKTERCYVTVWAVGIIWFFVSYCRAGSALFTTFWVCKNLVENEHNSI